MKCWPTRLAGLGSISGLVKLFETWNCSHSLNDSKLLTILFVFGVKLAGGGEKPIQLMKFGGAEPGCSSQQHCLDL